MSNLTVSLKWKYAMGQLGWSILSGIIQVWLVWFYNPPEAVELPAYIPRNPVFMVFTVIGLITMLGRLMDGITDPWIASLSDRSRHRKGRRIPFMEKAVIPFTALTIMVFIMPTEGNQLLNSLWLVLTLLAYYVAYTAYVAPYFALTSELGQTEKERLDLSTYIALTWFIGYIIASAASFIWPVFQSMGYSLVTSIRLSIALLSLMGFAFMLIPVLTIDEKKYVTSKPNPMSFSTALKSTLGNRNFLLFEIFFLAYGIAITIFQTGNVYYVTVLLGMGETWVTVITAMTGLIAFTLYPVVNFLAGRIGKKPLCIGAMILLILAYVYCGFLGLIPLPPSLQALIFACIAGIGFAVFGILPNAIVADIAQKDGERTGIYKEAMFFSVQTFMNKLGQMIAMVSFSSILLLGKNPGDDLGIRMTGFVAAVTGFISLLLFTRFREEREDSR
ncbi:MAG: MFS transporter [Spirochaetales bacterium]|nr:MFS transporter [Spirochaetales bacterium]